MIPLDNPALCPICRVELVGQVIRVYGDVVFCGHCISSTRYYILNRVVRRCHDPRFAGLFVTSSGLVVLSPKRWVDRSHLNELFCFTETDTQYDYPQFVGIVPDDHFKPFPPPPRTTADPRHTAHCPDPIL